MDWLQFGISIIYLVVFPGFLFLFFYALFAEYIDRKLYARMQNRVGPPYFQPFADFFKLLSKEDLIPKKADPIMFSALPIFGFAAVLTAYLYVPIWRAQGLLSFPGDIIVVAYLLSIPTLALFLAGWHSTNIFGQIGSMRAITQLFGYEVPFLLAILAPCLLAGTWNLGEIIDFQLKSTWLVVFLPIGFIIALITLTSKLERIPFDIPEAETEIVAGHIVEYSGRRLALFRLVIDMELVVGASVITVLFLGGFSPLVPLHTLPPIAANIIGFITYILKTLFVIFCLATIRTLFARLRIDQMATFCFKWLAPLAIVQLLIAAICKYWMGVGL
jgi:NADH-quinone oxidoreductase subunit H